MNHDCEPKIPQVQKRTLVNIQSLRAVLGSARDEGGFQSLLYPGYHSQRQKYVAVYSINKCDTPIEARYLQNHRICRTPP